MKIVLNPSPSWLKHSSGHPVFLSPGHLLQSMPPKCRGRGRGRGAGKGGGRGAGRGAGKGAGKAAAPVSEVGQRPLQFAAPVAQVGGASSSSSLATVVPAPAPQEVRRRQLDRRDSYEIAERALDHKFEHRGVNWRTKVTADGLGPIEYVRRQHKKNKAHSKKLDTKFWIRFFADMGLDGSAQTDLLEAPPDLSVRSDLVEALGVAHNGNPAGDPSAALCSFLEHCEKLNRAELFGLFCGAQEGPSMSRAIAARCQVGICDYLNRTDTT